MGRYGKREGESILPLDLYDGGGSEKGKGADLTVGRAEVATELRGRSRVLVCRSGRASRMIHLKSSRKRRKAHDHNEHAISMILYPNDIFRAK